MAFQGNQSHPINQQPYAYPSNQYYPQVVVGTSPSQAYQQQNYASFQVQQQQQYANCSFRPPQQQYRPFAVEIANAPAPTPGTTPQATKQGFGLTSKTGISSEPPLDYQILLLSMAEEYFNAAHGQGSLVALAQREVEMERYYKLVATGLGCLESVLKVNIFSLIP